MITFPFFLSYKELLKCLITVLLQLLSSLVFKYPLFDFIVSIRFFKGKMVDLKIVRKISNAAKRRERRQNHHDKHTLFSFSNISSVTKPPATTSK